MNQMFEAIAENSNNNTAHVHRDDTGSKLGMWLFLFTELLLFGGMFLVYATYRFMYIDAFSAAASELNPFIGAVNTIVLLTSSLTIALSIVALQKGNKILSITLMWFTLFCGLAFMINKYFEWTAKFHHGIYPKGPALDDMSNGEVLFFGLYYVMTGLHGLHVLVGMIFIAVIMSFVYRNKVTNTNLVKLENAGLYWHLVDIIWIFLFPLFYLIN